MKICVLGIDGATPDAVFNDERLINLRRLMDMGVHGRLKSEPLHDTLTVWMSMGASQVAESINSDSPMIWNLLASLDARSALIGLISDIPPYEVNGVSVACFPTSTDAAPDSFTDLQVGKKPADLEKSPFAEQVWQSSSLRWQTARSLFSRQPWACFELVDLGLQAIGQSQGVAAATVSDYYLWLDEQIGSMLELLDDETVLLIVSPRGSRGEKGIVHDGMFVLISPNCPLTGEYEGATLLDMVPTMLDLIGHEIPSTMQGKSLVAKLQKKDSDSGSGGDEESLIRDRLAGLGYI